jgi:hypothetical protein
LSSLQEIIGPSLHDVNELATVDMTT